MKRAVLALLILLSGCQAFETLDKTMMALDRRIGTDADHHDANNGGLPPQQSQGLKSDVYGPGIHENRYGQPVTLTPDHAGVPGERLQIRENAYGPGVHADQYGRTVRERLWP